MVSEEGPLSTGVEHLLGSSPDCLESKLRHLFLSLSLTWEVFGTGLEAAEDVLSSKDVLSRMRLENLRDCLCLSDLWCWRLLNVGDGLKALLLTTTRVSACHWGLD